MSYTGATPVFPDPYGPEEREKYYKHLSYSGWGGSSGHDSVLIAYDALLGCNGDWESLIERYDIDVVVS